jgi:hypothetical protein
MTTAVTALPAAIEAALIGGDLSGLSTENRITYYNTLCEKLSLNPLSKPFNYIILNGKLTLYATKDCTDQLRTLRGVSVTGLETKIDGDIIIVTASGKDATGRTDCATGAVDLKGLIGEKRCNAIMKAETKAKRRLTLSLCGLGMVDESEVGSIEGAKVVEETQIKESPKAPEPSKVIVEEKAGAKDSPIIESWDVETKAEDRLFQNLKAATDEKTGRVIFQTWRNSITDPKVLTAGLKIWQDKKASLQKGA